MTSDSIILDAATKVAFSRGEGLVAAGSVTSWEARVRPEGGLTQLLSLIHIFFVRGAKVCRIPTP